MSGPEAVFRQKDAFFWFVSGCILPLFVATNRKYCI